jgi:SpoVK/Ycf46/Vps4 family AAA+-type ATPase
MTALKGAIARQEQQEKERQRGQQDGEPAGSSAAATAGTSAARDDSGEGEEVVVTHANFLEAVEALQPSLSAEEVAKYERIRDQYNSQQAR